MRHLAFSSGMINVHFCGVSRSEPGMTFTLIPDSAFRVLDLCPNCIHELANDENEETKS